jgi:hypothetical protein
MNGLLLCTRLYRDLIPSFRFPVRAIFATALPAGGSALFLPASIGKISVFCEIIPRFFTIGNTKLTGSQEKGAGNKKPRQGKLPAGMVVFTNQSAFGMHVSYRRTARISHRTRQTARNVLIPLKAGAISHFPVYCLGQEPHIPQFPLQIDFPCFLSFQSLTTIAVTIPASMRAMSMVPRFSDTQRNMDANSFHIIRPTQTFPVSRVAS